MEYFREKDGKYFSKATSAAGGKPVIAVVAGIIPLIIFAGIFYQTSQLKGGASGNMRVVFIASTFVFINLIAFFFRKAALGSGIIVDQMERTVKYKRPHGQRRTLDMDSIQKINLEVKEGKAAVLSLISSDGNSLYLNCSTDVMMIRQMADELATLISVTVNEEAD